MTAALSHIRSTSIPSRSRLIETLSSSRSVKEAAGVLELHPERVAAYARQSDDPAVKAAYRACVERGKRKRAVPTWLVMWADPRTPGELVQIWTVHAETEEAALEHAVKWTRRDAGLLTVKKGNTCL